MVIMLGLTFSFPSNAAATTQADATQSVEKSQLINVNKATAEQLSQLPGIGKTKAQAIVDYRTQGGKFKSVADLTQVKGIGDKLVAKLEGKVTF